MADPDRFPSSNGDDTDLGPDHGSAPSTPRWVKVLGIIAIAVVVLFVILLLLGGHGPGRHMSCGVPGGHALSSTLAEHGAQQP